MENKTNKNAAQDQTQETNKKSKQEQDEKSKTRFGETSWDWAGPSYKFGSVDWICYIGFDKLGLVVSKIVSIE